MSFGITRQNANSAECASAVVHRVLTCYTPQFASMEKGYVSMTKDPSMSRTNVVNNTLVTVPAGAIVDMIEYSGVNSFSATGEFSIGLGQLNHDPSVYLIEGGTSLIANDNVGGCRQFISELDSGENNKVMVPYSNCVNFMCKGGVQKGSLRVDIYYHKKP